MTSKLRPVLLFNAAFSAASGLLLLLAPSTVGGWLGVDIDGWLRLAGVVLIGHGALIVLLLGRLAVEQVAKLNLVAIAGYPLLMIVLVVTGLVDRSLGQVLVLVDGAIIAAVAALLFRGLQNLAPARQPQHA